MRVIFGSLFLLAGLFFFFSAVLGLFRFDCVLNRMHAAALGDTMGLLLTVIGSVILRGFTAATLKLLLIPLFFFLTSPVTSHLIAKIEVLYHGNMYQEYQEEDRR